MGSWNVGPQLAGSSCGWHVHWPQGDAFSDQAAGKNRSGSYSESATYRRGNRRTETIPRFDFRYAALLGDRQPPLDYRR